MQIERNEPEAEDRRGMTPEQWEQFRAFTRGFGEQSESGVDISLLCANLKIMPTEHLRKMFRRGAVLTGRNMPPPSHAPCYHHHYYDFMLPINNPY